MSNESRQLETKVTKRGFLALVSLGLGAVAVLASPLRGIILGEKPNRAASDEFPGEDSIFHPRRDPREAAQERRTLDT